MNAFILYVQHTPNIYGVAPPLSDYQPLSFLPDFENVYPIQRYGILSCVIKALSMASAISL